MMAPRTTKESATRNELEKFSHPYSRQSLCKRHPHSGTWMQDDRDAVFCIKIFCVFIVAIISFLIWGA
jgi:hypothetical protein